MTMTTFNPLTLSDERYDQFRDLTAILRFKPVPYLDAKVQGDIEEAEILKQFAAADLNRLGISMGSIRLTLTDETQIALDFDFQSGTMYDEAEHRIQKELCWLDLDFYQDNYDSPHGKELFVAPMSENLVGAELTDLYMDWDLDPEAFPVDLKLDELTLLFSTGESLVFNGEDFPQLAIGN